MTIHVDILYRYDEMLHGSHVENEPDPGTRPYHLRWMLRELFHMEDEEKAMRWLGFIQGCLIAQGYTTVQKERDFTRPYFRKVPDYYSMSSSQLLIALGTDASKWAEAFNQIAQKLGYSEMDEGWLIGWFANAMEAKGDSVRGKFGERTHWITSVPEDDPDEPFTPLTPKTGW